MKLLCALFLLITVNNIFAQHSDCSTKEFSITGAVKNPVTVDLKSLDTFKTVAIADIVITNHKGEKKSDAAGLKGILLKDILKQVAYNYDSPKELSEFYFVFTACDGYKVVYSWNEIYNTATGDNIYIITEKQGLKGDAIKEGILSLSATDIATGRRYIKGLASIQVNRVQ